MIQSALICSPRDNARTPIAPRPRRLTAIQSNFFHQLIGWECTAPCGFRHPSTVDSTALPRYQPPLRLSHKLGKILSGEALESARRHTRAIVRNRRFPVRVSADTVVKSIDRKGFKKIRRKYAVDDAGDPPPKYLDLEHWIRINLQRVRE